MSRESRGTTKKMRTAGKQRSRKATQTPIGATLETLQAIRAGDPKTAAIVELLTLWLEDDSGYDEDTWPKLKKGLDEARERSRARKLFDE